MIDGIPIGDLSAPALLGLAILLLLTGRLWSNPAYKAKSDEAEKWRLAYEAERDARATSDAQTAQLLELAKTTHAFITATFSNSEQIRRSGEADAIPKT